jgi:hypothetical protein
MAPVPADVHMLVMKLRLRIVRPLTRLEIKKPLLYFLHLLSGLLITHWPSESNQKMKQIALKTLNMHTFQHKSRPFGCTFLNPNDPPEALLYIFVLIPYP